MIDWVIDWVWYLIYAYITVRLSKAAWILIKSVHIHLFAKEVDVSDILDSWAVVTGGTDGIGKAYTFELARARGIRKFFLIGRNINKLEAIKKELVEKYDAEVKLAVFDFENDDFDKLPADLKNIDVGILLNCAGIAPAAVGNMVELPEGLASKILRVNLMSNIKMLETVLPGMVKRDRGIIVNVASMTGWRPLPYLSTYPCSKAAISFYSEGIADEFGSTNVKIQCLIPMLVATKVASYDAAEANDIFVVSTDNFARQAVHLMGLTNLATGCWQHDLQIAFASLVSPWLFKKVFVPLVMLGVHKQRVADYASKHA
ncbi:dhs-27 [Pristionchus pacificus]|uniref:Dhs-27 n=1 Tax=Pristionchus pacificus TaxID=54126 RepID=A0A2A6BJR0_PRIPA|nr:dhs-27 [Pristionchus pacificus]|eukprot:PDM66154.1 dhs-27 [Pristionchus pacificus]